MQRQIRWRHPSEIILTLQVCEGQGGDHRPWRRPVTAWYGSSPSDDGAPPMARMVANRVAVRCRAPSCTKDRSGTSVRLDPIRTTVPRAANGVGLTALGEASPKTFWRTSDEDHRAISGPLTPVTSGLSQSLADTPRCRSDHATGPDGTDSQADSAGSIPVTRSNVKVQVGCNFRTLGLRSFWGRITPWAISVPLGFRQRTIS